MLNVYLIYGIQKCEFIDLFIPHVLHSSFISPIFRAKDILIFQLS
jgi:hypothetical protein